MSADEALLNDMWLFGVCIGFFWVGFCKHLTRSQANKNGVVACAIADASAATKKANGFACARHAWRWYFFE